ncbi:MAG: DUF420 domain-containing protein, partial [Candidatus Manganitrophaceae bacterium]
TKTVLWYGVLISITAAYLVALAGVRSAKRREVEQHSRRMIIACTVVGIWLVAYVAKQVLFGRETFNGTPAQYWRLYMPLFMIHMILAVMTIGIGAYNLYMGLSRFRQGGSVGAMAAGLSRHRRLGILLVWSFSGTMVTAYLVYLMLFVWF